jgi:hypothetical protein
MCLAMLERKYPALKNNPINDEQINFLTDANLEHTIEKSDPSTYFTVVRNPFKRIVSVYRDLFEKQQSNFLYSGYLFDVFTSTLSFTEFINRLASIPDSLKDQHLKPQSTLLKYYEMKKMQVVTLKLEEPEKLREFLTSHSLEYFHRNSEKKEYRYEDYYTLETLEKVRHIYRADIEKFGYHSAYASLFEYVKSINQLNCVQK